MNVEFSKKFEKKIASLNDKKLLDNISESVSDAIKATTIQNIPNIKKLKSYKSFYRIRTGNYRIGIFLDKNDTVWFADFAHRKDIYKSFP